MNGCEYIKCPDWFNGVCNSTADYVNKATGENMCCRNDSAIPRYQYLEISEHELEYQDKISQLESALSDSEARCKVLEEALRKISHHKTTMGKSFDEWYYDIVEIAGQALYEQALAPTDAPVKG